MYQTVFLTALLAALCGPAWAINKCTGADGKVVFQDAPCSGKGEVLRVRPGSGHEPVPQVAQSPAADVPAKPRTEAQRIEALIAASQGKRRLQELEVRLVPDAQGAIDAHRAQCDGQMKALQVKKYSASNNLAGATWEGSISGEMTAIATRCDTRNRELKDDYDALRKECQAAGGCK
ncbi:DUF4124 domain-containing protein [Rhodoferax sp.]|uniref:DUF4124 domain-containing protein n=1 Tax=Rhodoferax sp. TaxID=50421 RepID=UPI0025FE875C|nr:DUF4124 domain-containing protein [Rhodoferax sp.]MCM2340452.1 DUF4124 domain-containing protein [Rhodoferax sp.]